MTVIAEAIMYAATGTATDGKAASQASLDTQGDQDRQAGDAVIGTAPPAVDQPGHAAVVLRQPSRGSTAQGQKGHDAMLAEVRQVYSIAQQLDVMLDFQWQPRSSEIMVRADQLSKQPDTGAFIMLSKQASWLCTQVWFDNPAGSGMIQWGNPSLDVFGGSAKDEQRAKQFFTEFWMPGSAGTPAGSSSHPAADSAAAMPCHPHPAIRGAPMDAIAHTAASGASVSAQLA